MVTQVIDIKLAAKENFLVMTWKIITDQIDRADSRRAFLSAILW